MSGGPALPAGPLDDSGLMNRKQLIPHLRELDSDRVRVPAHIERRLEKLLGHEVQIRNTTQLARISVELMFAELWDRLRGMVQKDPRKQ